MRGSDTMNAQNDDNKLHNLNDESLDGIAGGYIHFEGREGGVSTYSILSDETGEELERVSVASGDDYAAMIAAKERAIELGLSPKKINDYQLNNLRNS